MNRKSEASTSGVAQTLIARNTLSRREQEEQRASEKMQDSRLFNFVLCKWILVKICSELQGWQDEKLASFTAGSFIHIQLSIHNAPTLCIVFIHKKKMLGLV